MGIVSATDGPCWELEERPVDSEKFFRLLATSFPEATTAYFEGTSVASDVANVFRSHVEAGPYVPNPETIWSFSLSSSGVGVNADQFFRCRFTPALCDDLARAAANHAEFELCDHLSLYAGEKPLLEWPDAFGNCIWIASSVSEERIAAFAAALGLGYQQVNYGRPERG